MRTVRSSFQTSRPLRDAAAAARSAAGSDTSEVSCGLPGGNAIVSPSTLGCGVAGVFSALSQAAQRQAATMIAIMLRRMTSDPGCYCYGEDALNDRAVFCHFFTAFGSISAAEIAACHAARDFAYSASVFDASRRVAYSWRRASSRSSTPMAPLL